MRGGRLEVCGSTAASPRSCVLCCAVEPDKEDGAGG